MSIIVKGMEMPENCWECIQSGFRTAIGCTEWTKISAGRCETERAYSCPITALPDKHGRLVDADAMCNDLATVDQQYETMIDWCIRVTEAQPTIVEAEGEG